MRKNHKNLLRKKSNLFALFLLISLLLHVLIAFVLQNPLSTPEHETPKVPIPITMQERKNWLELDQKPPQKVEEPPENATHIAEANQTVKRETAPKAEDGRDQQRSTEQIQQKSQPSPPKPDISPPVPEAKPQPQLPPTPAERYVPTEPVAKPLDQTPPVPIDLPNLKTLTSLSPKTLARLDRQRDRPEIKLKDDEVWLNLRQDVKLISFFRRFSDRIEAVWNYPTEAARKGIQGTLLVKIVINKKGELLDALPIESSGSDILDYEAIQAIYRAAPFGPLPSYYEHDQLKIFAYFQYTLNRRMIYGN